MDIFDRTIPKVRTSTVQNQLSRVGIVTVTFNSGDVLPEFLDSVAAQVGVEVHLFSIDNASSDNSVEQLRAETRIKNSTVVANDTNVGVAVGNNQGIQLALDAGCDWVLLLNNDTSFDAGTVAKMVTVASENELDLLAPLIEATEPASTIWYDSGEIVASQGFRTTHRTGGRPVAEFAKVLAQTGYASTCCLLVHPRVFAQVGLMDPVYFVYFDDVDFAVRCARAGFHYWVTPEAQVLHKASSLTGGKSSPFTIKWTSRNWPLIAKRHLGPGQGVLALTYIQLWMVARLITRRDTLDVFRTRQASFKEGIASASAPAAPRVRPQADDRRSALT